MREMRNPLELSLFAFIIALGLLNGMIYGGVLIGDAAVQVGPLNTDIPPGSAPGTEPTRAQLAERNDSPDLPGRFVPSQGKRHTGVWPLEQRVEFCPPGRIENTCYASNPPTSGLHVPVTRNARLADGNRVNLPPDPGIYDFEIPREAIPHIQEHAGVFIGHNCAGDAGCDAAVARIESIVTQELSLRARVVISPSSDLDAGVIALASWTRIDEFAASEFDEQRVRAFIQAHSCRYDPEGFCPAQDVN